MPTLILFEGPAGSGKSELAREALAAGEVDVLADLTAIWAALTGARRGPDGKYPTRRDTDPIILSGMAAYIRRTVVRQALRQDLRAAVMTGTRGLAVEYGAIAHEYGAAFEVRTVDPGEFEVRKRLAAPGGKLDPECEKAIARWYA